MSRRSKISKPVVTKVDKTHGTTEEHPAFGNISVSRVSVGGAGQGAKLFQSDVLHGEIVTLRVEGASRTRTVSHDFVFGRKILVDVEMSMAQWASLVSSFNTSGVPCTITRHRDGELVDTDELDDPPRLAVTMDETATAASRAFDDIVVEVNALEKLLDEKRPVREIREVLHTLKVRIQNAPKNVDFATRMLAKHAEDVVQKTRADIESMVAQQVAQLGLEPGSVKNVIELPIGDDDAEG